jgi:hypothetical protein
MHQDLIKQITQKLHSCQDESLLDLILKLLLESGY